MAVKVFWNPRGFDLDSRGRPTVSGVPADGKTPNVRVAIRLLSVDTPETTLAGVGAASNADERLAELARWVRAGRAPVDDALAEHLYPRLVSGQAGTRHQRQGEVAREALRALMERRLTKGNGRKRSLFLRAAELPFDRSGRLLAYAAPSYASSELARMSRAERATFNLQMVESGQAAPKLVYPNLAGFEDLCLFQQAGRAAVEQRRGIWADDTVLTGYEVRMCMRLHRITRQLLAGEHLASSERKNWFRHHVADLTTLEIGNPQSYHRIPPYNRLFIPTDHVNEAVGRLHLVPMGTA